MKTLITLLVCLPLLSCLAQSSLVRANKPLATIQVGRSSASIKWNILPATRPDIYEVNIEGPPVEVTFTTDSDSLSLLVRAGQTYPFVVLLNGRDSAFTQIKGVPFTKPAHFTDGYQKANDGKTITEIPEFYELINILFTLTPTFQADSGIVSRQPPYYQRVNQYFAPFMVDPAITLMDSLARAGRYFYNKMDAYAFEFDQQGRIVRSTVYDRINWGRTNSLLPFIARIQSFADKTQFRRFYQANHSIYATQINAYRDSLNVSQMVSWLNKNFPGTRYNTFKIIWSPLVGNNQSANWFNDNGFKEMQAHVNFPYLSVTQLAGISAHSNQIKRGNIVFTEINHSFINPESEKRQYADGITNAFANLPTWAEGVALKNYGNTYLCFNEYMNWGLVSLRYIDYADHKDLETLVTNLESRMVTYRGFRRFAQFNRFLIDLYQGRKPGTTVADLYPQIVAWFIANK